MSYQIIKIVGKAAYLLDERSGKVYIVDIVDLRRTRQPGEEEMVDTSPPAAMEEEPPGEDLGRADIPPVDPPPARPARPTRPKVKAQSIIPREMRDIFKKPPEINLP